MSEALQLAWLIPVPDSWAVNTDYIYIQNGKTVSDGSVLPVKKQQMEHRVVALRSYIRRK